MVCECLARRAISKHQEGDYLLSDEQRKKKRKNLCKKRLIWSIITLLILLIFAFITIWVIIPISFMLSLPFQTFMVFIPIASPRHANFSRPENFGLQNVYNFYISTRDYYDYNTWTNIGAWLILPENSTNVISNNVTEILQNTQHDVLIYLHGVFANRAKAIKQYRVLRKYFLIIAIDHRGYGDSGNNVEMTEAGIVNDHLQIFDWVQSYSENDIYYWGHSLGSGMTSHTVKLLKNQRNTPKGVVLESSFTAYEEVLINNPLGKMFSWLPYFNATILKPLNENDFQFSSKDNILSIDCPIMILHAEDDNIVPYFLGKQLAEIAQGNRKSNQGIVSFHGFSANYSLGHNDILMYSEIGGIIEDFKRVCRNFSKVSS